MEGSHCRTESSFCDATDLKLPVLEFGHADPRPGLGCTVIIGGEVYRGSAYPALNGMYFYADGCTGWTWGLSCDARGCQNRTQSYALPIRGGPRDGGTVTSHLTFGKGEDGSIYFSDFGWVYRLSDGAIKAEPGFAITAAMSDAWYNPATPGQGILFTVLPDSQQIFAGFFTFELPGVDVSDSAILGDSGHRWVTAQGPYSGDRATLNLILTTGGLFDDPKAVTHHTGYGTLQVRFDPDCLHATAHIIIPDKQLDRIIPLERVSVEKQQTCLNQAARARVEVL